MKKVILAVLIVLLSCSISCAGIKTMTENGTPTAGEIFKEEMEMKIEKAADYIKDNIGMQPEFALILGSGLGEIGEKMEDKVAIPYSDIPGFVKSTVTGHKGQVLAGKINGRNLLIMQGRFHYYEGYPMNDVVFPVRVMAQMGIKKLIVTNAAGGINKSFKPGGIMLISDHINLCGINPLVGPNLNGERFPDMSEAYNKEYLALAKKIAAEKGIEVSEGVYCMMSGPSYETPAEIRFLSVIGGDAVGMSTVPEVIEANHSGMKVLGISCITNLAAGISPTKLNHQEVMDNGRLAVANIGELIKEFIKREK